MHPQREGGDFFDLYPIKCSFKHNLFCSKDVSPLGKSHQEEISVHVIHRQRDREKYSLISLQHCDSLRRIFLSAEKLLEEGSYFWEQDCYYLGTSWSYLLTFVWFCATHLCCKLNLIWSTEMSLFFPYSQCKCWIWTILCHVFFFFSQWYLSLNSKTYFLKHLCKKGSKRDIYLKPINNKRQL